MTKGLLKSCVIKSKLYKQYRNKNTIDAKQKDVTYRDKLKTVLQKAEKDFYYKQFKLFSDNLRQTWKLIGTVINKKQSRLNTICQCFKSENGKIINKAAIADKFHGYFASIRTKLTESISSAYKPYTLTQPI